MKHQHALKPVYVCVLIALTAGPAAANPYGAAVVNGQASFATAGNTLTVTNTPGAIINWQGFSIGSNEITRFAQQSASSAVLNRVISGNPSSILGSLLSNGRVYLVNPNGIVFGAGSTINVAGLVATTLNISNADFLAGRNNFTQVPGAQNISNAGNITAQTGGQIFLIAPNVENTGVINAPNGEILLAAGHSVELVNSSDPSLRVNITAPAGDATNVGQLVASAGNLGLFGTVVRNSGLVSADSAVMQGGKIVFKASRLVEAGGTISASGAGGGEIKLLADMQGSAPDVNAVLAASPPGAGVIGGGSINSSVGGLVGSNSTNGSLVGYISGGTVIGGSVVGELSGSASGVVPQTSSVTQEVGGLVAIGSGGVSIGLPEPVSQPVVGLTSSPVTVLQQPVAAPVTQPIVNSSGGGTIHVTGTLDASAPNGGNGGFIETSAAHVHVADTARISTAAPHGKSGLWLIDPLDYTISAVDPGNGSSWMSNTLLTNALTSTGVTIQTQAGAGNGDIFVNDAVSWSQNILSLIADRNVEINAVMDATGTAGLDMTTTGGTVNVGMNPDGSFKGMVNLASTTSLTINGNAYTIINTLGTAGSMTGADLQGMNAGLTGFTTVGYYALGSDIDASATSTWNPDGLGGYSGFDPVGNWVSLGTNFNGQFNGLGHSISNLYINRPATPDHVGLFGDVSSGAVRNVALANASVTGNSDVGGLVGNLGGSVSNSSVSGSVTGYGRLGGLVGVMGTGGTGSIVNGYASAAVTGSGNSSIGGLVGNIGIASVSNSHASGNVSGLNAYWVGGLAGENSGTISSSSASGNVEGASAVGGLVGQNQGTISGGSATGNATGQYYIGGLVGMNLGAINNSIAAGNVLGTSWWGNAGGLVGYNNGGSISYSSWIPAPGNTVGGNSNVGGLVGYNYGGSIDHSSAGGNGGSDVTGSYNVGGLVGYNGYNSSVSFSSASGNVVGNGNSNNIGGLVGFNGGGVNDSSASGNVSGSDHVGGLVGANNQAYDVYYSSSTFGSISNSSATGSVMGFSNVGGLVGGNDYYANSITANSYATGNVTGVYSVGGLVGSNDGVISNAHASGNVIGVPGSGSSATVSNALGGLVGTNWRAISNSYVSSGSVSGSRDIGGLVGYNYGTLDNSHYNINGVTINGGNYVTLGGLYDDNLVNANGVGQYTDWMNGGLSLNIANYTVANGGSFGAPGGNNYTISNALGMKDLLGFADNAAYTFSLGANIDLGANTGLYIPYLAAGFDGAGYVISNLNLSQSFSSDLGMFGQIASGSTVNNVALAGASVTGGYHVGALAGLNQGSVGNSSVSGSSVTGNSDVGGLVGLNQGTINNNSVNGNTVVGNSAVGGLAGVNAASINNSYVDSGSVSGNRDIGGMTGVNYGTVNNSHYNVDGVTINGNNAVTQYGLYSGQYGDWYNDGLLTPLIISNYASSLVGGAGSYTISDLQGMKDLLGFADAGYSFTLAADIGLISGYNVPQFSGQFDGGGFTLSGLNVNLPNNSVGLFGHVMYGSSVSNINLASPVVSGGYDVGALIGYNQGNVSYATASGGNVAGLGNVGGLVGVNYGGTSSGMFTSGLIGNSWTDSGVVTGTGPWADNIGGLVGYNAGGISNSHVSNGSISGTSNVGGLVGADGGEGGSAISIGGSYVLSSNVSGTFNVGGLVGRNSNTNIDSSHAEGTTVTGVFGSSSSPIALGGLVGLNYRGNISNSYVNNGMVSGSSSSSSAGYMVGGLVGNNDRGTISNSYASNGTVSGNSRVGGLVGNMNASSSYYSGLHGSITNSYVNSGSVTGSSSVGGLVGNNNGGSISNSYASNGTVSGNNRVGGLVGNMNAASSSNYGLKGSISESYVSNGTVNGWSRVGGLVGSVNGGTTTDGYRFSGGSITNSYVNSGSVTGSSSVGGLVGYNEGSISNSYASNGSVSGGWAVGGVVGQNGQYGTVNDTFWDTAVMGNLTNGIGYDWWMDSGTDNGAIGLNTAQMMSLGSFSNYYNAPTDSFNSWDFSNTWWMADGNTRPFLRSEWSSNITNAHQLQLMAMDTSASYTLANNLDLGPELSDPNGMWNTDPANNWNGSTGFVTVGADYSTFAGQFDGQGYTISNLNINRPTEYNVGLFGYLDVNGAVRNVGLLNATVNGSDNVGALAGSNNGTIENSYVDNSQGGTVAGSYQVGGLVGYNSGTISDSHVIGGLVSATGSGVAGGLAGYNSGTISNSYVSGGSVTGNWNVGGLVGYSYYGNIDQSRSSASVNGNWNVGGLVGGMAGGVITFSHATGNVTSNGGANVGGLVGSAEWQFGIYDSDATGSVTSIGGNNVGGLVGSSVNAIDTIARSFATGDVTGANNVGGLVGYNWDVNIDSSYATGTVTGTGSNVGGLVGYNGGYYGGSVNLSHASGIVSGAWGVGGLVGINYGSISNSYVDTGTVVNGNFNVGGLVGYNAGSVSNSHYSVNDVWINDSHAVTLGGLYNDVLNVNSAGQYDDWFNGGLLTPLSIANYSTLPGSAGSYAIRTADGMKDMLGFADAGYSFTLANNVTLSSGYNVPYFAGNFDGGGFAIDGLDVSLPNYMMGLFNHVAVGSTLNNVVLGTSYVTGVSSVGALAGWNEGTISNSHVSGGSVNGGWDVGGLVGYNSGNISNSSVSGAQVNGYSGVGGLVGYDSGEGTISNSYVNLGAVVSGSSSIGGLVGRNYGSISSSYFDTGTVTSIGADSGDVGGLVGYNGGNITDSRVIDSKVINGGTSSQWHIGGLVGNNSGSISNSYASNGTVDGNGASGSGSSVGGLVGYNSGSISNSYVSGGSVNGSSDIGGLVGYNIGSISNSYVSGGTVVTGSRSSVGGLAGANDYGTISNTFWDSALAGANLTNGVGYDVAAGSATDVGAVPLSLDQMKTMANFTGAGWDIANTGGAGKVWRIYEGQTAPLLTSFLKPLSVTAGNDSKLYDGLPYSGGNGVTYSDGNAPLSGAVLGTLTYGGTSQGAVNGGNYTISPMGLYSDQQGYDISFVNGALTVLGVTSGEPPLPDIYQLIHLPGSAPISGMPSVTMSAVNLMFALNPSAAGGTNDEEDNPDDLNNVCR